MQLLNPLKPASITETVPGTSFMLGFVINHLGQHNVCLQSAAERTESQTATEIFQLGCPGKATLC